MSLAPAVTEVDMTGKSSCDYEHITSTFLSQFPPSEPNYIWLLTVWNQILTFSTSRDQHVIDKLSKAIWVCLCSWQTTRHQTGTFLLHRMGPLWPVPVGSLVMHRPALLNSLKQAVGASRVPSGVEWSEVGKLSASVGAVVQMSLVSPHRHSWCCNGVTWTHLIVCSAHRQSLVLLLPLVLETSFTRKWNLCDRTTYGTFYHSWVSGTTI